MKNATVEAVKCETCGKLHELNSDDYVSVHGNVCRGMGGGLVGNNLDNDGKVENVSIYCFPRCLLEVLGVSAQSTRTVNRVDPFGTVGIQ
jgi:hypothetical protein